MKLKDAALAANGKKKNSERENIQRKCDVEGKLLWKTMGETLGEDNLEGVTIVTEGRYHPIAVVEGFPKDIVIKLTIPETRASKPELWLGLADDVGAQSFGSLEELGSLIEIWEIKNA